MVDVIFLKCLVFLVVLCSLRLPMVLQRFKQILFIALLSATTAFAQITKQSIDSLNTRAKEVTDFDSSNVLLDKAIAQAKAISYTKGLTAAVLTKGVHLFNRNQFEETLRFLNEWEKVILQSEEVAKMSHMYALRGNCYSRLSFFDKSRECLHLALKYAAQIPDEQLKNNNLARIYSIFGNNITGNTSIPLNIDSLLYYRRKSYNFGKKVKGTGSAKAFVLIQAVGIGRAYLMKKEYDSAKRYFDVSLALEKESKLEKYAVEIYMGYGEINIAEKKLDQAVLNYKKALSVAYRTKNIGNIKACNQKLATLYEEIGNLEKSKDHLKEFGKLTDSLIPVNTKAVKAASDFIVKDKEVVFEEKKTNYTLIIIVAVLVAGGLTYVLLAFRKRHKKVDALHQQKQQFLMERLEFLKSKTLNDKVNDEALKEIINLAMANDPAFLVKFQEFHPVFTQKLMERAPNLVTSDLLICGQLRLGFYTKEIARYTNTSVRAVEGKKYRVRKKLDIPASEDINVWMMQV